MLLHECCVMDKMLDDGLDVGLCIMLQHQFSMMAIMLDDGDDVG